MRRFLFECGVPIPNDVVNLPKMGTHSYSWAESVIQLSCNPENREKNPENTAGLEPSGQDLHKNLFSHYLDRWAAHGKSQKTHIFAV
jgi:hypothetical protein